MSSTIIIGLSGKKRSGKDTVAARLVEAHGFRRLAFADRLKRLAADLDPWLPVSYPDQTDNCDPEALRQLSELIEEYGSEGAKEIPAVRQWYKDLGEKVRDDVDPGVWIRPVEADIEEAILASYIADAGGIDQAVRVVVSDVRFPNEADMILRQGGQVWRIERPDTDDHEDTHSSETALDGWPFDAWLHNVGTIYALGDMALWALQAFERNVGRGAHWWPGEFPRGVAGALLRHRP